MIVTGWKKALEKSGRSQRFLSNAIDVNLAEVSMVVQGRAFFTPLKFATACELLGCRTTDIYDGETLAFMYGGESKPTAKPKRDTRVRLDEDVMELVEAVASHEHLTRTQAANTIIRRWGQE